MKGHDNKRLRRTSIRKNFLMAVLLTTVLSIFAASVTGYFCIHWIRNASEETLTEQFVKYTIQEKAGSVDARLKQYENYSNLITDSIENMYADEEEMIKQGRIFYPPVNTRKYELTRGFVSDDLTEEDLSDELRFYSNLERIWEPIAKENKKLITTMYLGTKTGLLVSYDRYSYLSCPPEGEELVYNYFNSEWYKKGIEADRPFCTDVYMDSQGRGLTITLASPFRDRRGNVAGVACMDFDLSVLYDEVFSIDSHDGIFTFALDQKDILISPDSDVADLQEHTGLTLDELERLKTDPNGILNKADAVYVCIPLEFSGWTLCTCVPREAIQKSIYDTNKTIRDAILVFLLVVLTILLVAVIAVNRSVKTITYPLELLGHDIKTISDGDLDYRASVYRNDEIGDITRGLNEMVDRLKSTMSKLTSSQQHADAMSKLATLDALTGVRNKTAFNDHTLLLKEELNQGKKEFGFVMVDMNNLKVINDSYGHEKGDIAIKTIARSICEIYAHSPVFRVGGDEFVVLLENDDYRNAESLRDLFLDRIRAAEEAKDAEPWCRVSAAIGYALYDENLDQGLEGVLARADGEMYVCKKLMKMSEA